MKAPEKLIIIVLVSIWVTSPSTVVPAESMTETLGYQPRLWVIDHVDDTADWMWV